MAKILQGTPLAVVSDTSDEEPSEIRLFYQSDKSDLYVTSNTKEGTSKLSGYSEGKKISEGTAPKPSTPIAAVAQKGLTLISVFFVDSSNTLQELTYNKSSTIWKASPVDFQDSPVKIANQSSITAFVKDDATYEVAVVYVPEGGNGRYQVISRTGQDGNWGNIKIIKTVSAPGSRLASAVWREGAPPNDAVAYRLYYQDNNLHFTEAAYSDHRSDIDGWTAGALQIASQDGALKSGLAATSIPSVLGSSSGWIRVFVIDPATKQPVQYANQSGTWTPTSLGGPKVSAKSRLAALTWRVREGNTDSIFARVYAQTNEDGGEIEPYFIVYRGGQPVVTPGEGTSLIGIKGTGTSS